MDTPTPRPLLATRGPIRVTSTAARQYARALRRVTGRRLDLERARHELTERLVQGARLQPDGERCARDTLHARARSRVWGVDLDVRCTIQEGRVVVLCVSVRCR